MAKADSALSTRNEAAVKAANPLFGELNNTWEKIEDFFRKQGVLRPVETTLWTFTMEMSPHAEDVGEYQIGIQKFKGKWRICFGTCYYQNPGTDWQPITECPTDRRIELLDYVDRLYEALVKSNETYVPELEEAVQKSKKILCDLEISDLF